VTRRLLLMGGLAMLLAACGRKGALQPPPGNEESAAEIDAGVEDMGGDDYQLDQEDVDEEP